MSRVKWAIQVVSFGLVLFFLGACEKRDFTKQKAVLTGAASEFILSTDSAVVTGTIIDLGEDGVAKQYGHCWATTPAPTYDPTGKNFSVGKEMNETGEFSTTMKSLEANTKYYVRTYVVDGSKIYYGEQRELTTGAMKAPNVTSVSINNAYITSAELIGNIDNFGAGSKSITEHGFCWSTSSTTTKPSLETNEGFSALGATTSTGQFQTDLTYLEPETDYYVRAYATNSVGTTYGEVLTFRTKSKSLTQSFTMISVQGGTFRMGLLDYDRSSPYLTVTVDNFSISKTEITAQMFADFMNRYKSETVKNGDYKGQAMFVTQKEKMNSLVWTIQNVNGTWSVAESSYANCPMVRVTWYGANEFCRFYGGRLPTEAEWEFAAGGGVSTHSYTYSGSNTSTDVAWFGGSIIIPSSSSTTHTVAQKLGNELGLYDMSGNAHEWCSDWYDENYYKTSPPKLNPQGATTGTHKSIRGGAWDGIESDMDYRVRRAYVPTTANNDIGFRIVR